MRPVTKTTSRRQHGLDNGYRSGLEEVIAASLEHRGVEFEFEQEKLLWQPEARWHTYRPDFTFKKKDGTTMYVESKGYLTPADRKKMVDVKRCNPALDIRFVFQRARTPINKGSKTTYGDWATKQGFQWSEMDVPDGWLEE
jgi:hypothetical protein